MDDDLDSIIDMLNQNGAPEQQSEKFQPASMGGYFLERPGQRSVKASLDVGATSGRDPVSFAAGLPPLG